MDINFQTVMPEELLARFILHGRYLRFDNTVKADAFMPHPYSDLSVTRHLDLTDAMLCSIGASVAVKQNKTLHGRADIIVKDVNASSLFVEPAPIEDNPFHANIKGWPSEKAAQKSIAQQIAKLAKTKRYL